MPRKAVHSKSKKPDVSTYVPLSKEEDKAERERMETIQKAFEPVPEVEIPQYEVTEPDATFLHTYALPELLGELDDDEEVEYRLELTNSNEYDTLRRELESDLPEVERKSILQQMNKIQMTIVKKIIEQRSSFQNGLNAQEDSDDESVQSESDQSDVDDQSSDVSDYLYQSSEEEEELETDAQYEPIKIDQDKQLQDTNRLELLDMIKKEYFNTLGKRIVGESTKVKMLLTIIRSYKDEPAYLIYLKDIDSDFMNRGEMLLFDFIIRFGRTQEDEAEMITSPGILAKFVQLMNDKWFQSQEEIFIHFAFEDKETSEQPIPRLEKEYTDLFYAWRPFEAQLIRRNPNFPNRMEFDGIQNSLAISYTENTIMTPIESFTKLKLIPDKMDEPIIFPKSDEDYQADYTRLITHVLQFVSEHGNTSIVWRLLDDFFTKRILYMTHVLSSRHSSVSNQKQVKEWVKKEYGWLDKLETHHTLNNTRVHYNKLYYIPPESTKKPVMGGTENIKQIQARLQANVSEEHDDIGVEDIEVELGVTKDKRQMKPAPLRRIAVTQDRLFPLPKYFLSKAQIETYLIKVNTLSELYRMKIDRDDTSKTFGKRIAFPVDLEREQSNINVAKEFMPLLECIITLCQRITVLELKENTGHLDQLNERDIIDAFQAQLRKSTVLYQPMIKTIIASNELGETYTNIIRMAETMCVEKFFSLQLPTHSKRTILSGLNRRAMRKDRIKAYHRMGVLDTPLSYACRVRCENIMVRPFDTSITTFPYVYPRQSVNSQDQDVFFFPTLWLKEKLCSSSIVVSDTDITVEGKRFFLGRLDLDMVTLERNVKEFTTTDYHAFLPLGGLSIYTSFSSIFHHKQAYLSRIYDQIERDMKGTYLLSILPTMVFFITTNFPDRNVLDILTFFYCFITIHDPTFQLHDSIIEQLIRPRIQSESSWKDIVNETDIVSAFYKNILHILPETTTHAQTIILYVKAFITRKISMFFPFLGISMPSSISLYLPNTITLAELRIIVEKDIPEQLSINAFHGVKQHTKEQCRYCRKHDSIPTIQFHRKSPRKVWVCEDCMDNFRVTSR